MAAKLPGQHLNNAVESTNQRGLPTSPKGDDKKSFGNGIIVKQKRSAETHPVSFSAKDSTSHQQPLVRLRQPAPCGQRDKSKTKDDGGEATLQTDVGDTEDRATTAFVNKSSLTGLLAEGGGIKEISALLANGANIQEINEAGRSALHIATYKNDLEMIEFLLKKGIDSNTKEWNGWTALHQAASNGNCEAAKLLLKTGGADINAQDKVGSTPLYQAALNKKYEMVDLLIRSGADINNKRKYGETALMVAAGRCYNITKALLRAGADINAISSGLNVDALHYSMDGNKPDVANLLLAAGINANNKNMHGDTPLNKLADYREDEAWMKITKNFLRAGAKIDSMTPTPLKTPEDLQFAHFLCKVEKTFEKERHRLKESTISHIRERIMRSIPNSNLFAEEVEPSLGLPHFMARELLWKHELSDKSSQESRVKTEEE